MGRANPGASGGDDKNTEAVTTPGADVGKVFAHAVRNIQGTLLPGDAVVDIEITFRSVTINSKGIPLFTNRTEQSTMEMRLATRIRPSEPGDSATEDTPDS